MSLEVVTESLAVRQALRMRTSETLLTKSFLAPTPAVWQDAYSDDKA